MARKDGKAWCTKIPDKCEVLAQVLFRYRLFFNVGGGCGIRPAVKDTTGALLSGSLEE